MDGSCKVFAIKLIANFTCGDARLYSVARMLHGQVRREILCFVQVSTPEAVSCGASCGCCNVALFLPTPYSDLTFSLCIHHVAGKRFPRMRLESWGQVPPLWRSGRSNMAYS